MNGGWKTSRASLGVSQLVSGGGGGVKLSALLKNHREEDAQGQRWAAQPRKLSAYYILFFNFLHVANQSGVRQEMHTAQVYLLIIKCQIDWILDNGATG